jgi:hypothetical protein
MCESVWKFSFFRASQERHLSGTNYLVKGNFYKLDDGNSSTICNHRHGRSFTFFVLPEGTLRALPEETCRAILARRLLEVVTNRVRRSKIRCPPSPAATLEPGSPIP